MCKNKIIIKLIWLLNMKKQDKLTNKFEKVAIKIYNNHNKAIGSYEELKKDINSKEIVCKLDENNKAAYIKDELVAIIEIINGVYIKYIDNAICDDKDLKKRKNLQNEYAIKDYPVIALVLESPHKKEFELNKIASSFTGKNINKYFLINLYYFLSFNTFEDCIYNKKNIMIEDGIYKLILINPIQYQCSLGLKNSIYKNDIFKECWKDKSFKNDFIKRLTKSKPTLIINCCTGQENGNVSGLQKLVQNEIDKNFKQINRLYGYHPSSKHFVDGFKKCN